MRVGTTIIFMILLFAGTFYLLGCVITEYQQLLQENALLQQQLNHSLAEVERLGGITAAIQTENHVLRTQLSQQCPPVPSIQAAAISTPDHTMERGLFSSSVARLLFPVVGAFAIATLSTGGGWYYAQYRQQPTVKQRRQF